MKILIGYMVLSSTILLGFLGGRLFTVAIYKYELAIDQISFFFAMYNFSIVGTVAIFYQKGIPTYINQAYLVATSVIVAWQLSYFNDWMAWALLIMLALYDLFAVLTPCGPLKALVNLMQKDDAPAMPGLLYEARLPEGATRPGRRQSENSNRNSRITEASPENGDNVDGGNGSVAACRVERPAARNASETGESGPSMTASAAATESPTSEPSPKRQKRRKTKKNTDSRVTVAPPSVNHRASDNADTMSLPLQDPVLPSATLPLAIAKVYKLPLVSPGSLGNFVSFENSPTAYLLQQFSAQQLQTDVEVMFPIGGGRIETTRNNKGELRYVVYNRDGEMKRTLLVDENGKVMEEIPRQDGDKDEHDKDRNTIKLGLGDFIFYSVLVSKAAGNGFAPFLSCFLSILTGLGGTLVLLAVYHHALPALPISIFLAVIFFVLTIYCMEPWIHDMWQVPYYV